MAAMYEALILCEKNRCIFERANLRFTAGELSLAKAWT
jgi:hypothetical protein